MSLIDIVKHARPMKLKDGKRHVWPTLASMVYLKDGTTPLADEDGKITADDAIRLGGKAPEYYTNPRNLLDNSDFEIAQAGYNAYHGSTKYGADRWRIGENGTLTKNGEIKTLTSSDGYASLTQILWNDNRQRGKTYTLAIELADGTIHTCSGTVPNDVEEETVVGETLFPNSCSMMFLTYPNGNFNARINAQATGSTISFKYAVMLEGSYTAETLPPHVPKEYAAEMAACQQYLFPITGSPSFNLRFIGWYRAWNSDSDVRITVQTPIPMPLDSPNLLIVGDVSGITMEFGGVNRAPSLVQIIKKIGNFVMLKLYMNNVPISGSHPALVSIPETVKLFISCEP